MDEERAALSWLSSRAGGVPCRDGDAHHAPEPIRQDGGEEWHRPSKEEARLVQVEASRRRVGRARFLSVQMFRPCIDHAVLSADRPAGPASNRSAGSALPLPLSIVGG